jgi:hypothetical protein
MIGWKKHLGAALLSLACAQAWSMPTLSLSAVPATAAPGSTVNVAVMVSDIVDLYTYQFSLNFNSSVLNASGYTDGGFLGSTGIDTFGDGGTVDNGAGTISFAFNTLLGPESGVSGGGVLAYFSFDALAQGMSALTFSDVLFLNSAGQDIALDVRAGSVAVAPATDVPEPDSWMLLGAGASGIAAVMLRRRMPAPRA